MEKISRDFTGMKTSAIYKEVRQMLSEDVLEYFSQKYERAARISNTEIAVVVGTFIDEDGFTQDVCGILKAQSKPFYSKTENVKREVQKFDIDDAIEEYEMDIAVKEKNRKSPVKEEE
jgi:hypothetical protein